MLMVPRNNGLFDISKTLMSVTSRVEKQGPLDAEIVPGIEAGWYILITQPGQGGIASSHLIGRRFGVYEPRFPTTTIERGRKVTRWRNFVQGYIFVFVWGIDAHRRRILSVPGVQRLLCTFPSDTPFKVPDALIDKLRAQENLENPIQYSVAIKARKRRKKRRLDKQEKLVQAEAEDIVSVSSKSYWSTAVEAVHVNLLEKALGLPQGGLTESAVRVTG
jgi:transcription antitermination factor NusG